VDGPYGVYLIFSTCNPSALMLAKCSRKGMQRTTGVLVTLRWPYLQSETRRYEG